MAQGYAAVPRGDCEPSLPPALGKLLAWKSKLWRGKRCVLSALKELRWEAGHCFLLPPHSLLTKD